MNAITQYDEFGNAIEAAPVESAAAEAKRPLTRVEKLMARTILLTKRIQDATKELDAIQLEIQTAGRLDSVKEGTVVIARLGRAGSEARAAAPAVLAEDGVTVVTPAVEAREATAGTLKEVEATVLGIKEHTDGSLRYKLAFGEGFDADTVIVQATQILSIQSAE